MYFDPQQGRTNLRMELESMTPELPEGPTAESSEASQSWGCRRVALAMFLFALTLIVITIVEAVMRAPG